MPTPLILELVGGVWGVGVSCVRAGERRGRQVMGTHGSFGGFPGALFTGGIGVCYPVVYQLGMREESCTLGLWRGLYT